MRLAAQAKGGLLSRRRPGWLTWLPSCSTGPGAAPAAPTRCASWTPAAGPETPWPSSPACCATAAPYPWRPAGWNCIGTGRSRRHTCLDRALACDLFATSIANNAFGVLLLNPPYDFDAERTSTGGTRLPHSHHALPDRRRAAAVHSPQAKALRSPPATSPPTTGTSGAGPSPSPEREVFDQVVLVGRRKGGTQPRPLRRGAGAGLGRGGAGGVLAPPLPGLRPAGGCNAGDILFATRTVDPLGGGG